jgi:hypothetical protein
MRYCNFILHAYSQMYDGPVHGHSPDARSSHDTGKTQLRGRNTSMQCGNSAKNRHNHQIQRGILRQGLSLPPHSSKHSPHARSEQAVDMPSTMPRREPEPRARKGGEYVDMQGRGQGRRARIGAPLNEQLVGSKAPAGGRRAERAEEPSLLIGVPTPLRSAMQSEQGKGARTFAIRETLSGKLR